MKKIKDNFTQLIELMIIVVFFFFPKIFDFNSLFSQYISETTVAPDNVLYLLVLRRSNLLIGIMLAFIAFIRIRKHNKDSNVMINRENVYHSYPIWWYWFSSKILGIPKCNLINVPIFNQIRLVINNVFDEYPFDDNVFPVVDKEEVKVNISNIKKGQEPKEINLILEDTYIIDFKQLPHAKRSLPTVKVSRNEGKDCSRRYSPEFVDKVVNEVRQLGDEVTMNVFATTNPKNLFYISKSAFTMANRGNIKHLFVFQQLEKNGRHFKERGKKVY